MRIPGSALLLLASTAASVALGEIALRAFAPVVDPYWDWRTRTSYIPSQFRPDLRWVSVAEEGLPGVTGQNVFSVNRYGFRGGTLAVPKPPTEYRVFIIGGSTTECVYLDDHDAINAVLQRRLQEHVPEGWTAQVFNAGKSGDRSDDHVAMLAHRIVHLQPDLVIVFSGVNDLRAMMAGFDYLHLRVQEELGVSRLLRLLVTETQLGRRLYYFLDRTRPRTARETAEALRSTSNYRKLVAIRRAAPAARGRIRLDPSGFRANLQTIAGIARAHDVKLVLMTHQTTWNSDIDPRVDDWQWLLYVNGRAYPAAAMDSAMDNVNQVIRTVGREASVPVFDLAHLLPKSLEYFYDDVHFNVRGAEVAGTQLADFIALKSLVPRPAYGAERRGLVPE